MFRIGGMLLMISYLSVILIRPFAKSGASGETIMTGESLDYA